MRAKIRISAKRWAKMSQFCFDSAPLSQRRYSQHAPIRVSPNHRFLLFTITQGAYAMKKILIASAFAMVAGSAIAADMPAAYKAAPPVIRPTCAQLGGFSLGGSVGYGYYTHRHEDRGNIVQTIDD